MFGYCTRILRLAEAVAYKRIRAARVARQFPQILDAIADGRVHVTGLAMLAPHMTAANVDELIVAAAHRTKHELEKLVARLAPQPDVPARIRRLPAPRDMGPAAAEPTSGIGGTVQLDPDPVPAPGLEGQPALSFGQAAATPAAAVAPTTSGTLQLEGQPAPEVVRARASRSARVKPLAPERFALQMTISQVTRGKLERARDLMRHSNPSGDLAEILDRALDLLLRRTVHDRDDEQSTFVSADGVRCTNRALLEYDHRTLACRGGQPTVEGMGLMCKAHNQYEAERALGLDFMRQKRAAAKRERAARKQSRAADADAVAADANAAAAVAKRPTAPATGQLSMHMPQPSPESSPADATGTSTSFHPDPTSRAARAASTPTRSRCSEDLTMRYRPWRDRAVLAWSAAPA